MGLRCFLCVGDFSNPVCEWLDLGVESYGR
jgi:hypothetical protein